MNEENEMEGLAPWLVVAITLVGGGLRVLLLAQKGLWLNETFSLWLANQNTADLLHWVVNIDQNPPLYYLLLHYWIALTGDTVYQARLLSVLFSAATIPLIYLTGRRMSGEAMGLAAAALLAFSPFHIRLAQETRMYALLGFNAAAAIYALAWLLTDARAAEPVGSQLRAWLRTWRAPKAAQTDPTGDASSPGPARPALGTGLTWAAYVFFSAAALYTHNTAVLLPLAANGFVLGLWLLQKGRPPAAAPVLQAPPLGSWVKAQLAILLLWCPWLLAFVQQAGRVEREFGLPAPTWETVFGTLRAFLNDAPPDSASPFMLGLAVLALGLGLLHFRKRISSFVFLAALFAIPLLGELLVSLRRPVFYDRSLVWVTLPLLLGLAAGIALLKQRFVMILAVGILGSYNLLSSVEYYRSTQREEWAGAAGYVAYFAEKGDLILFNASWVQIPFDRYFMPYEEQYLLQVEKHGAPSDLFESGALEPKMTQNDLPRLDALLNGRKRAWLVSNPSQSADPAGLIQSALAARLKLTQARNFNGVRVQLYSAP